MTATAPARIHGLTSTTLRLTRARFASATGERLLYGASVLAATVASAVTFTFAGGTWMFWQRNAHPTGLLADLLADPTFKIILGFYVGLAALACAMVLPALLSLVSSGVQLGARGRERRLAALRLLGLSSGDVTRMALVDALIQVTVGTVVGALLYLVTLPLWTQVTFQAVPIRGGEMLLPAWLFALLCVVLVLLGLLASALGLQQVRISPLGVSRRTNRPAVRRWRVVAFVAAVIAASVLVPNSLGSRSGLYFFAGIVVLLLAAVNTLGPWLLQTLARLVARVPSPVVMTSARRIMANPTATWRRTSTLAVLAFVAGYLAKLPFSYDPKAAKNAAQTTFMQSAQGDFVKGAAITMAVGFLLTATSLLIGQASATIERAEQSRALHRLGAPRSFDLRVMWLETFVPLTVSTLMGGLLGLWAAAPMARMIRRAGLDQGHSSSPVVVSLAVGLTLAAGALWASHPLHRRLLAVETREAD